MKLRTLLPAAVAVGALAIPSAASADPPVCPDHFEPTLVIANPDWISKDENGNFIVCHKETPGNGDPTKDDNGIITSFIDDPDPDNWADDILP
jgi:hypothetical protein